MRIVGIIQARMGSTRLPGKMLLPLAGKPVIEHVCRRVLAATTLDRVHVTIPLSSENDELASVASAIPGVQVFRSMHEADLIRRHLEASQDGDIIVRVPGDNPCVMPEMVDEAVRVYLRGRQMFYSNTTAEIGCEWWDGVGAEVFSRTHLEIVDGLVQSDPLYREHVHRWFYDNYMVTGHAMGQECAHRLDLNTNDDYRYLSGVFMKYFFIYPLFGAGMLAKENSHAKSL